MGTTGMEITSLLTLFLSLYFLDFYVRQIKSIVQLEAINSRNNPRYILTNNLYAQTYNNQWVWNTGT